MPRQFHIALIVETSTVYGRRLLRGIAKYLRAHGPWSVFLEQRGLTESVPAWIDSWEGDGIISRVTTPQLAERLAARYVPVVDLTDIYGDVGLPQIWSDDRAIGRLAAEHLLERGFRQFAFCGFSDHHWSRLRGEGFAGAVRQAEATLADCFASPWTGPEAHDWEDEQHEIGAWLQALPKPVGIMASNDMRGQHVLDACSRMEIAVPEEAAVIGCDNDEVLCELCNPPLSSVAPNPERIGFEAAELLHQLMSSDSADHRQQQTRRNVSPVGVVTRQSTDVSAIGDPLIAAAVQYVRENACGGITVDDILRHVSISRSMLERGFRRYLRRSPHAEIRHVQMKKVCQLLSETDLTLQQVAELTGFAHPEYLSVVFKREMRETPGGFRQRVTSARSI